MPIPENEFLSRAYALSSPAEAQSLYDQWAASYDDDLSQMEYTFPASAAAALSAAFNKYGSAQDLSSLSIYDAGCGTGLVGIQLSQHGFKHIDGCDISSGMLAVARKTGSYGELDEVDLTKPIEKRDGQYDAVICVGTLTKGHVGPQPVLGEFVRIVKQGGFIVATVREDVWESSGFEGGIDRLVTDGKVKVQRSEIIDINASEPGEGRLLVLKTI